MSHTVLGRILYCCRPGFSRVVIGYKKPAKHGQCSGRAAPYEAEDDTGRLGGVTSEAEAHGIFQNDLRCLALNSNPYLLLPSPKNSIGNYEGPYYSCPNRWGSRIAATNVPQQSPNGDSLKPKRQTPAQARGPFPAPDTKDPHRRACTPKPSNLSASGFATHFGTVHTQKPGSTGEGRRKSGYGQFSKLGSLFLGPHHSTAPL